MATELAKAYVQIMPTTKNIKSLLEAEFGAAGDSAGNKAGQNLGNKINEALKKAGVADEFEKSIPEGTVKSLGAEVGQILSTHTKAAIEKSRLDDSVKKALNDKNIAAAKGLAGQISKALSDSKIGQTIKNAINDSSIITAARNTGAKIGDSVKSGLKNISQGVKSALLDNSIVNGARDLGNKIGNSVKTSISNSKIATTLNKSIKNSEVLAAGKEIGKTVGTHLKTAIQNSNIPGPLKKHLVKGTEDGVKESKKKMKKGLEDAAEESGKSAGSKIGSMIKRGIAAAGIGTVLKSTITEGMELEQNLGGTEAVFGKFAQNIQQSATTAYKNMGLSASGYMATANKMGSLFQGSGLEQRKALDLTSQAMQRAADVASVMGIDMDMAMESIAGAAKGNFTMMDNLGVAMNATTIEAYALEKGINFKWNTASNAEKAEIAMQMFFERTQQYAGNFARESEQTLSGSLGAVKSAFQNVLGDLSLGRDFMPSLRALIDSAIVLLNNNLLPMVTQIISGLPSIISNALVALVPVLITSSLGAITGLLQGIATAIPTLIPQFVSAVLSAITSLLQSAPEFIQSGVDILMGIVTGIIDSIPILTAELPKIIDAIIVSLTSSLDIILSAALTMFNAIVEAIPLVLPPLLQKLPDIITKIVVFLVDSIDVLVDAAVKLLLAIVDAIPLILPPLIDELPNIISTLISELLKAIPQLLSAAVTLFLAIVDAVPKVLSDLIKATAKLGKSLVQGLWNGIKDTTSWILDKIKGFGTSVLNGIKDIFGIHSPSTETGWMGKMLDVGLGKNILDNIKTVLVPARKMGVALLDELTNSIVNNTNPVKKAMDDITKMTTGTLTSDLAVSASLGVNTPSAVNDKFDRMISIMTAVYERLLKLQIVLDSGEVVGGIAEKMDSKLGENNILTKRGVAT